MRELRASDATKAWGSFQDTAIRMALVPRPSSGNAGRLESAFLRVMESLGRDRLHQKTDVSRWAADCSPYMGMDSLPWRDVTQQQFPSLPCLAFAKWAPWKIIKSQYLRCVSLDLFGAWKLYPEDNTAFCCSSTNPDVFIYLFLLAVTLCLYNTFQNRIWLQCCQPGSSHAHTKQKKSFSLLKQGTWWISPCILSAFSPQHHTVSIPQPWTSPFSGAKSWT